MARQGSQSSIRPLSLSLIMNQTSRDETDLSTKTIITSISAGSWMFNKLKNLSATIADTKLETFISKHEYPREQTRRIETVHNRRIEQECTKVRELTKFIDKMARFDVRTLTPGDKIHLLLELIRQINSIRQQWAKIIRFFTYLDMNADQYKKV